MPVAKAPMRVGLDISPLAGHRTGVGTFCFHLARHLLRLNTGMVFLGFSSGLRRVDLTELDGLSDRRHIPIPTRAVYRLWSSLGIPRVDSYLGGVDVFHATNYFLPPVRRARRVLSIYDLAFLRYPELGSPKIVGVFSREIAAFARQADAVVTCSESSRNDLVELLGVPPERIHVTYGGVNDDFCEPARDDAAALLERRYGIRGPFLLFVGTIEPRKNVAGLLRAYARVAPDYPHALVLVGEKGWRVETLFAVIKGLTLENRVMLTGFVPRSDLPAFYAAADAFVFPSYYEGFGLPILEAFAAGCPVIAADRSSLPEVVGDAGILVNPEDEDALAETVRRVIEDAALRDSLSRKGKVQAARFTWEETARITADLYRRLAA